MVVTGGSFSHDLVTLYNQQVASQTLVTSAVLQKVTSEANPKVRNHGEGPSRGLLRDYEPSDLLRM